jgi:Na+/H+-dicarboxylate symporter/ABC-type amino acid transport substrate-binding protein
MSFSRKILVGLAAGVATGLFFGEKAAVLEWAADGFVRLLQMTVLPYVTISIVGSLGRLDYAGARALGLRVGAVIVALWMVALLFAFLIPLTFPQVENASFFSTALIERRPPFDFVSLYIPSNPFYSLANNIVPAVVLFSVVLGLALIGVEQKQALLGVLQVVSDALSRTTRFVTALTPYGLFAIAATAAGTLDFEQLERLQIYLLAYVAVSLFVSLWVLPGLIAAVTPVPALALLRGTRDPLITAFVAGDLFIVLPSLIEESKALLKTHGVPPHAATLPDVIVPASFNLPHSGKLLSMSFILFAAWFADAALSRLDYPRLAFAGLVSFFGSLNAAVPFLLDLFRIPADTFQLFIATGVINSRFGTLLAASHTLAVAVIGACAMSGALTWKPRRLMRYGVATAVVAAVILGGARGLFATALAPRYTKDQILAQMNLLQRPAPTRAAAPAGNLADGSNGVLGELRRRGLLRVGYIRNSLPYAFNNVHGDLVGFDIELAHRLAEELGVGLELVEVPPATMAAFVEAGQCDLVMSGVGVTTHRAADMLFSASYLDETLALLVPDHDRERFASWAAIQRLATVTIAVPDVPYFVEKLRAMVPRATVRTYSTPEALFSSSDAGVEAIGLAAERGSAWTLLYPQYSVVVPEGTIMKIPIAYPIGRRDAAMASFINTWIDLKRKDGTLDTLFKYWMLGQNAAPKRPRWSIARDVLHWIE